MQQDNSSFWTDIKTLEERLANSPDSFCFAKLSEVYLKVGLIEDALHTARQGITKHPSYLAGQRALAMASHAKGLTEESLAALRIVTEAMPDDLTSQKLLGRLLIAAGDLDAARIAFNTVLEFTPDDMESRLELESLERPAGVAPVPASQEDFDDDEIIEDLEILEELELYEEEPDASESGSFESALETETPPERHHDPLSTGTLAELYVSQGFIDKALEIYRAILNDNPANSAVSDRVSELELMLVPAESPVSAYEFCDEAEEASVSLPEPCGTLPADMYQETPVSSPFTSSEEILSQEAFHETPIASVSAALPTMGTADNALSTLEGWLENIRRIRSCR
ncbi:MAG: tetratricopeptide repeat protein [Deltaproteobacteria bacterium]|nr:tetratricopeptide repeat protein [Deltaproteobacteria bacterium]